jgi:anti-sigma regulatory factor (Ser/Thr protein kinase)
VIDSAVLLIARGWANSRTPGADVCWEMEREFPGGPAAPGLARTLLRTELDAQLSEHARREIVDDAVVVISELVTNAVEAATENGVLAVHIHHGELTIKVTDRAEGWPTPQRQDVNARRGRGLMIVDSITASWGVTVSGAGKTVWATLALPEGATALLDCSR